jgi:hypothetical protein
MYRTVLTSLIVIIVMPVLAQSQGSQSQSPSPATKCTLTVAEAPAIRGVKLGMTTEQLFSLFPGSARNEFDQRSLAAARQLLSVGSVSFGVGEYNSPHNERLKDVNGIFIQFFDAQIVDFTVQYTRGPNWFSNLDDLVAKFSEALHLPPPSDWTASNGASKVLKCNGFEIEVGFVNGSGAGRVSMRDPSWQIKAKQRREAEEERLRRDFKP